MPLDDIKPTLESFLWLDTDTLQDLQYETFYLKAFDYGDPYRLRLSQEGEPKIGVRRRFEYGRYVLFLFILRGRRENPYRPYSDGGAAAL